MNEVQSAKVKSEIKVKWMEEWRKSGALWVHDGEPKRPHALLANGEHSGWYFDAACVIENPTALSVATEDLLSLTSDLVRGSRVVGSDIGAAVLAHELAVQLACKSGYTEPGSDGAMALKRFCVGEQDSVLVVGDVITTGSAVRDTINAVHATGAQVCPYVLALFNRSGDNEIGGLLGSPIVALVDHHMPVWLPDACPLCPNGSHAVGPEQNWALLTADYSEEWWP